MKADIPWNIIIKILSNSASADEMQEFNRWKDTSERNNKIYNNLKKLWDESETIPISFSPDARDALKKVKSQLKHKKQLFLSAINFRRVAALIAFIAGISVFFYYLFSDSKPALLELTTTNNKTDIVLSDGSHIWLNENSKICYPSKFKNIREIKLMGEAYFEVAKQPDHPFVISANHSVIKVLGTHFSVRSFSHEQSVNVMVTEGKVSLSPVNINDKILLTSGDQGILLLVSKKLVKEKISDANFLSWKTNEFTFENQPLEEIIRIIAENYHVRYKFLEDNVKRYKLNVTLKKKSITEICHILSQALDISIESDKSGMLIISKKK
jgi:transmembrane sensor